MEGKAWCRHPESNSLKQQGLWDCPIKCPHFTGEQPREGAWCPRLVVSWPGQVSQPAAPTLSPPPKLALLLTHTLTIAGALG